MSKRDDHLAPIIGPGPKTKRRIGVMPTRREADKRKKEARRPARHDRGLDEASFMALAYISHP